MKILANISLFVLALFAVLGEYARTGRILFLSGRYSKRFQGKKEKQRRRVHLAMAR